MPTSEAAHLAAKAGQSPGAATYTGAERDTPVHMRRISYGPAGVAQHVDEPGEPAMPPDQVTWLDLDGVHDVDRITGLAKQLGWHPLTVEDALNVSTPAKLEAFESYILVVVRTANAAFEQVSFVFGDGWLVTLQERPGDVFQAVRDRIEHGRGRIRTMGADYLLHALLDAIVDSFFVSVRELEEEVAALEELVLDERGDGVLTTAHEFIRRLERVRRVLSPLPGVTQNLLRADHQLFTSASRPFFRDLRDHAAQAVELIESLRRRVDAVMQLHLALQNHRMSEVMRLLTIVSTLFIPLTFVVGVYGMNFDVMPELRQPYGYPVVMGLMAAVAGGLALWFRRRGWL